MILVVHWLFLAEPRWLAVLHTIVFTLMIGYWAIAAAFILTVRRRRPDWFGEV